MFLKSSPAALHVHSITGEFENSVAAISILYRIPDALIPQFQFVAELP